MYQTLWRHIRKLCVKISPWERLGRLPFSPRPTRLGFLDLGALRNLQDAAVLFVDIEYILWCSYVFMCDPMCSYECLMRASAFQCVPMLSYGCHMVIVCYYMRSYSCHMCSYVSLCFPMVFIVLSYGVMCSPLVCL